MRFFWIFLLAGCSLSGQINKMQVLGLGSLTSTQRDGITVPSDRTYFIYNSTTGQIEYNQGGTTWQNLIGDPNTDNQTLSFSSIGNTLSITGGNSISLPLISWGSVNGNINPILNRAYSIGQQGLVFDQIHGNKIFGATIDGYSVAVTEMYLKGSTSATALNGTLYYDNGTAQLLARVGNVWHDLTAKHKAEVITTNLVNMDGWKMVNDKANQAVSYQLTGCEPGERLTIYINRASAPLFTGTGLTFNLLPNSEAFASNTEMAIYLEVAYDGTTVDYYYQSR